MVQKRYLFLSPSSENDVFPPFTTCRFWLCRAEESYDSHIHTDSTVVRRSIVWSENDIYSPPPSENDIFSPSCDTLFFDSHRGLFALILPYFAFILPFYFPFSHFLSPFFLFFSFIFSPFFSSPFHIFSPQMTSADISPPGGGGIFQYIDPCSSLTTFEVFKYKILMANKIHLKSENCSPVEAYSWSYGKKSGMPPPSLCSNSFGGTCSGEGRTHRC